MNENDYNLTTIIVPSANGNNVADTRVSLLIERDIVCIILPIGRPFWDIFRVLADSAAPRANICV